MKGELAAILGSGPPPEQLANKGSYFRWCWKWLDENAELDFSSALEVALINYREQVFQRSQSDNLGTNTQPTTVLPDDWAHLMAWCEKAAQTDPPRPDDEPGLPLFLANGTRDHIALKSLFAGVGLPLAELPRDCFVCDQDESESWKLDHEKRPRIGAFIRALGSVAKSYRIACDTVGSFPVSLDVERAPHQSLNNFKISNLERGLVVFFQVLHRDHANFIEWREVFNDCEWKPEEIRTTGKPDSEQSLRSHLEKIIGATKGGWKYLEDIVEILGWKSGLRWHLDLLCMCNVLEHRSDDLRDKYRVLSTFLETPPTPVQRPDGMYVVGERLKGYLRDSLGFQGNDHAISTIVSAAFIHTNATEHTERQRAGSAFLERFLEGSGPPWLIEVCRGYVRDQLSWREEHTWPLSIRPAQVNAAAVHHAEKVSEADVLIVGGGMAGLYFAYRFLKKKPDQKLILLEALGRLGGRLTTAFARIDDRTIKAEEGGMRFLDQHVHLMHLFRDLEIENEKTPFGMGDENNLYYFRGKRFTRKESTADNDAMWSNVYKLRESERHKTSSAILGDVVRMISQENHYDNWFPSSPEEWDKFRNEFSFRGLPLHSWSFWGLLRRVGHSEECITMIRDCGGFAAPYDDSVNGGAALQLMMNFPANPQFMTLKKGYGWLPHKLGIEVRHMKGDIREGFTVKSFDVTDGGFQVTARNQSPFEQKFVCKKLVLALPRLALEELLETSPPLYKKALFRKNLASVITMPLTKINLFYENRWWWQRYHISNGGSFTNLPVSQIYCYDPDDAESTEGPAVLTIYCDSAKRIFWHDLQERGKPYTSQEFPDPAPGTHPASIEVVREAQQCLEEIFGDAIPKPVLATYKAWGTKDVGDGDHQWRVGINDREVRSHIRSPHPDVFVCGETYSDEQCWVEGALRSVEYVLQGSFGFTPPTGLRPVPVAGF